jgi:hypothetical protein
MGFNEYGNDKNGDSFLTAERVWRHWLSRQRSSRPAWRGARLLPLPEERRRREAPRAVPCQGHLAEQQW